MLLRSEHLPNGGGSDNQPGPKLQSQISQSGRRDTPADHPRNLKVHESLAARYLLERRWRQIAAGVLHSCSLGLSASSSLLYYRFPAPFAPREQTTSHATSSGIVEGVSQQ